MVVFALICAVFSPVIPAVLGLIAALFAPLGAYLVARRQFSGRVETSDAKALWAESKAIREWSSGRIAALEGRIEHLEEENADLRAQLLDKVNA